MRLSPCVLVRPDGWAQGEREGYGEPCDVTSLSLSHCAWTKEEVPERKHNKNLHTQSEALVPAHIRVAPAGRPDDGRAAVPEGPGAVAAPLARRRRRRRFE